MDLRVGTVEKIKENQEKAEALASAISGGSPVMRCIGFILLLPLSSLGSLIGALIAENLNTGRWDEALVTFSMFLALTSLYLLFRKKLIPAVAVTNGVLAGVLILHKAGID